MFPSNFSNGQRSTPSGQNGPSSTPTIRHSNGLERQWLQHIQSQAPNLAANNGDALLDYTRASNCIKMMLDNLNPTFGMIFDFQRQLNSAPRVKSFILSQLNNISDPRTKAMAKAAISAWFKPITLREEPSPPNSETASSQLVSSANVQEGPAGRPNSGISRNPGASTANVLPARIYAPLRPNSGIARNPGASIVNVQEGPALANVPDLMGAVLQPNSGISRNPGASTANVQESPALEIVRDIMGIPFPRPLGPNSGISRNPGASTANVQEGPALEIIRDVMGVPFPRPLGPNSGISRNPGASIANVQERPSFENIPSLPENNCNHEDDCESDHTCDSCEHVCALQSAFYMVLESNRKLFKELLRSKENQFRMFLNSQRRRVQN